MTIDKVLLKKSGVQNIDRDGYAECRCPICGKTYYIDMYYFNSWGYQTDIDGIPVHCCSYSCNNKLRAKKDEMQNATKHTLWSDEDRDTVLTMRNKGKTFAEIAEVLGRTVGSVTTFHSKLSRGIVDKKKGDNAGRHSWTPEELASIKEMRLGKKMDFADIGKTFGVTEQAIRQIWQKNFADCGERIDRRKMRCPFDERQIETMKALRSSGATYAAIAKQFGSTIVTVRKYIV